MSIDAAKLYRRLGCCRFCGGQPAVSVRRGLRIYCPDCGRHRREIYYDVEQAVEAWNDDTDDDIPFYGDMDEGGDEADEQYARRIDEPIGGKLMPVCFVSGLYLLDEDEDEQRCCKPRSN